MHGLCALTMMNTCWNWDLQNIEKMISYSFCVIWTRFDKANVMMIKMMTLMTMLSRFLPDVWDEG